MITGASGLLGSNLALELSKDHEIVGVVHTNYLHTSQFLICQTDLTVPGQLEKVIKHFEPAAVINCAGLTKIDQCEREPERAKKLNTWLPKRLAELTLERGIRLIHVSTATVFDGRKGSYRETDSPNPLSLYSRTKLKGEQAVQTGNPEAVIARVSMFGWSPTSTRSLAEFFFHHLRQDKKVPGFTDAIFSPILVNQIAALFYSLFVDEHRGLFHVCGSNAVSKYDFGRLIAREFGFDPENVVPATLKDYPFSGERSPNVSMDNHKLRRVLNVDPLELFTGLKGLHTLYQHSYPQLLQKMLVDD